MFNRIVSYSWIFCPLNFYFHFAAEHDREFVELPPELCHVLLSPISVDMIYSYKFMPSVMQRIESLLIAFNLKKNIPKVNIPTIKVQLSDIFFCNLILLMQGTFILIFIFYSLDDYRFWKLSQRRSAKISSTWNH